MQISLRSQLVSGTAAVLGATALTLAPVHPLPNGALPGLHSITTEVDLAATVNPVTRWLQVFDTSEKALAVLINRSLQAPAPVAQQIVANQLRYLSQLPDIPLILDQVFTNLGAAIEAPFALDTSTLDFLHSTAFNLLPTLITIPPVLEPLLDFTTTYTSGVLVGLAGPVIAPVLALGQSLTNAWDALTAADFDGALNELVNIPANMVNAFLNGGQTLDLTPVVNLLDAIGITLPVTGLGVALGGLLTPARNYASPSSKGGSLFNTLSVSLGTISVNGAPTGPIGSFIELTNTVAKAIGWSGTGNPLNPSIPVPLAATAAPAPAAALAAPARVASAAALRQAAVPKPATSVSAGEENGAAESGNNAADNNAADDNAADNKSNDGAESPKPTAKAGKHGLGGSKRAAARAAASAG